MTLMTRKPVAAAFELNGDDVAFAMVVRAASLFIHAHTDDLDIMNLHGAKSGNSGARAE